MAPKIFFISTVILSVAGILGLFTGIEPIVAVSVMVTGLGFANIFPFIFSIALDTMPHKFDELTGLMVTAIVVGAFIPSLMGILADKTSATTGFLVTLAAITYIGWISLKNYKLSAVKD